MKIPLGLKKVRKAVPKPTIAFKRKNRESRKKAKEHLMREYHENEIPPSIFEDDDYFEINGNSFGDN